MERYEKPDSLVNVLHDVDWHGIMPGPIFYGQRHEEGITVHGGNDSFAHLLEYRNKHISYPCDERELFGEALSEEKDAFSEDSSSLNSLFAGISGWTRGTWHPFGGDEVLRYALFEDSYGWFACFLESRTSRRILEGQEHLREKLEELMQLYSVGEILDPLTAVLRETLDLDWTGVLSWNSGEERWTLAAYNGGERGEDANDRALEFLRDFQGSQEPSGVRFGDLDIGGHRCWWVEEAAEKDSSWRGVLKEYGIRSFFAGTLVQGAQPMLFLGFSGGEKRITRIDREIFRGVWPLVCSLGERYRLIGGMAVLSQKDKVTGLDKGTVFLDRVSVELSRNRRYSYPISLLYANLRNEEALERAGGAGAVEDGYRLLARECLESIRVVDIIGRLDDGGLLILLPHTNFQGAQVVSGRMKERFRVLSPLPSVSLEVTLRSLSYSEGLIPDTERVLAEIRG